jgi:hypothetical protein
MYGYPYFSFSFVGFFPCFPYIYICTLFSREAVGQADHSN